MENKDILIQGYWVEIAKKMTKLEKTSNYNAKSLKEVFLEGIEILDKIIELEDK